MSHEPFTDKNITRSTFTDEIVTLDDSNSPYLTKSSQGAEMNNEEAETIVQRVRNLHAPWPAINTSRDKVLCHYCGEAYPCQTVKETEGLHEAAIRADERKKAAQRVNDAAMKIALAGINRFETADFLDLMDAAVRGGEQGMSVPSNSDNVTPDVTIDERDAAIQRVRDLHKPSKPDTKGAVFCVCCSWLEMGLDSPLTRVPYPCETIEALDGEQG